MAQDGKRERDRPWIMRTYSGHSTAAASNELYRTNLAKGQTGLSVAFDLPTQTGYDADDPLARGEVGKVGVPISQLGDMRALFDGIPLDQMNTSMTINATAVWLLALYIATAEDQGVDPHVLRGTTQNDIIKEYLSRGTHIFPPAPSMRLITDLITYTVDEVPKWNPINICSYHLQEAGATPTQELAYALVTAIGVLDAVKATGRIPESEFGKVVGRISFFVNAGIRFVEELCKMRAFVELWDKVARERYGVTDPKQRRFRYGVQVNSLGLTRGLGRFSYRPGTRPSASRAPGISNGLCGPSRSSLTRPISWSMRTCLRAARWWRQGPKSSSRRPGKRCKKSSSEAARSKPSRAAISSRSSSSRTRLGCAPSKPESRSSLG
jgi:(2R)-ethylmalonyl-CoA mutase